ncbi:hypothetical protein HXX76_010672 [Chlamydomonas incerta]|uniref:MIF4G domain-containing protein n=1 Tax=Chlamydomonas incerta TaxID=51695 RepID=A0A835SMG6_CHLIN|nr:hypothetical protein HXX76_010672 [Chlamydomonas incerta]|eukprot:KAG2429892.1 hypothetical protein HXX76_010672 [Chlamydomonas incerta]
MPRSHGIKYLTTAKRLAFEIRDVGFTPAGSLNTLQLLVRWIYDRAVSDPERFAGPCSALCFSLTPILPNFKPPGATTAAAKAKRIDFRQTLLNLCQREFEAACGLVSSGDAPALKAGTSTTTLSGSLQFLAYLYLHALLTDRIMLSCLLLVSTGGAGAAAPAAASDRLTGEAGRQRVECLTKALGIAGRQLDDCLAAQHRPLLDGLYEQLSALHASCSSSSNSCGLPSDVVAALGKLLELRAGGWRGAGGAMAASAPASAPSGAAPADGGTPQSRSARTSANGGTPGVSSGAGSGTGGSAARAAAGSAGPGPGSRAGGGGGSSSSPAPGLPPIPNGSAAALAQRHPVLRRVAGMSGNGSGSGTPVGAMSSRGSSTNLDGMWNLAPDTYSDVRAQLLSQPVASSPATLEAMADELIECAVAASGGDALCPCWGGASVPVASTAGAVAGDGAAPAPLSDEDWATAMQQQWDEQSRACDIYVRLAADALQNLGAEPGQAGPAASPGSPAPAASPAGVAAGGGPNAAAGGSVSEAGRTFRRLLLLAAQTHFERCLSALMPTSASTASTPSAPSAGGGRASSSGEAASGFVSPLPVRPGVSGPGTPAAGSSAAVSPSPSPPPESTNCATPGSASASGATGARRAWGDMPAAAPDAASALPRARGMCHLLLGLLRRGVLTPRIVLHCAAALVDGAAAGSTGCLQCACILLAGAGKEARGFKVAEAAAFESLLKRLQLLPDEPVGEAVEAGGGAEGTAAAAVTVAEQRRRFMAWLGRSLKED